MLGGLQYRALRRLEPCLRRRKLFQQSSSESAVVVKSEHTSTSNGMNAEEFRRRGKQVVDYIAAYRESLRDRRVTHGVTPGYIRELVPDEAPEEGEAWTRIFQDVETVIQPGLCHWQSPRFHGFYPLGTSFPSFLGEMLSIGLACPAFTWSSNPAGTELEMTVTDWLCKMLGLPNRWLHQTEGPGGGVIQTTTSETTLLCLLAARDNMVSRHKKTHPDMTDAEIMGRLVAYTSEQANCSVQRAGMMAAIKMRQLATDTKQALRGATLRLAMAEDIEQGLIPFFLCATLGTTSTCAFDNLVELGPICDQGGLWLHVDAAYAGSAFVCPENRKYMAGVEHATSFSVNPHKWLLCNYDLSVFWISDRKLLQDAFRVDTDYLDHQQESVTTDFRHWQIPLGRRFRALKLWCVLRSYGVKGLQNHIRQHCQLAKLFQELIEADGRFEVKAPVVMGLVCFCIKHSNQLSERLFDEIRRRGSIYLTSARVHDTFFLRLVICSEDTTSDDIKFSYDVIKSCADDVMAHADSGVPHSNIKE